MRESLCRENFSILHIDLYFLAQIWMLALIKWHFSLVIFFKAWNVKRCIVWIWLEFIYSANTFIHSENYHWYFFYIFLLVKIFWMRYCPPPFLKRCSVPEILGIYPEGLFSPFSSLIKDDLWVKNNVKHVIEDQSIGTKSY